MQIGNLGKYPGVYCFDRGGILAKFPIGPSEHCTYREGHRKESTNWNSIGS
ncbi:MAG: hypothetical protein ACKVKW_03120 [Flavobacteriales bacterium]